MVERILRRLDQYLIGKYRTICRVVRWVIAFPSHALVPCDLDGLDQLATALSAPSVTGEDEDGLLTMGEVLKSFLTDCMKNKYSCRLMEKTIAEMPL